MTSRSGGPGDDLARLVAEFLERRRRDRALTAEAFAREHPDAPDLLSQLSAAVSAEPQRTLDLGAGDRTLEVGEAPGEGSDRTQDVHGAGGVRIDGRYEVLRVLGQGGFGRVCLVRDNLHGGELRALKTILPEHSARPEFARRFQNEIRVLRALSHPGIPQIFNDGRTQEGEFYYTMAFVEGRTLSDVLEKEAPLRPERIVGLVRQMLSILEYAHRKGVVHRDLKPSNVMLVRPGAPDEEVRILDFGIAKVLRAEGELQAAQTMHTIGGIGTPHYMSPEQIRGKEVDERSDLYALGIIIYQMCSGLLPFSGKTDLEIATARLENPPRPLEETAAPAWLRQVVSQLLERERNRRPSTQEVHEQFEKLAKGQLDVSRSLRWVAVALLVVSLGVTLVLWRQAMEPEEEIVANETNLPAEVVEPDPSGGGAAQTDTKPAGARSGGGGKSEPSDPGTKGTQTQERIEQPTDKGTEHGATPPAPGRSTVVPETPAEPLPVTVELALADGARFAPDQETFELEGTSPEALSSVRVNGHEAELSEDGLRFAATLDLAPGKNTITVVPLDRRRAEGRTTTLHVVRESFRTPDGCQPVPGTAASEGRPRRVRHEETGIELVLVEAAGRTPFYLGLREVTRAEFAHGGRGAGDVPFDTEPGQPVVMVDIEAAREFCLRNRLRLPTEEEWLFAGAGPEGRAFPWGDAPDATRGLCLESDPGPDAPAPAGSRPGDESWCGVLDLGGNVSEWTEGPGGPVVHGGSWTSPAEGCRLTARKGSVEVADYLGFRVALDVP